MRVHADPAGDTAGDCRTTGAGDRTVTPEDLRPFLAGAACGVALAIGFVTALVLFLGDRP